MTLVKVLRNIQYQNKRCKNVLQNYSGATTGRMSANALASLSFPSSCNCRICVTTSSKSCKSLYHSFVHVSHPTRVEQALQTIRGGRADVC